MDQPTPRRPTLPNRGPCLTRGGIALVSEVDGSIGREATGLYFRDHRLVNRLEVSIADLRIELLQADRTGPGSDRLVYGLWHRRPEPEALLTRTRTIDGDYVDTVELIALDRGFDLDIEIRIGAGGAPVFRLFDPEPTLEAARALADRLDPGDFTVASGEADLHPGDPTTIRLVSNVALQAGQPRRLTWALRLGSSPAPAATGPEITCSDPRLEQALRTGRWDLDALTMTDPASDRAFLAAGAPHFLALFGRDALIAALLSILTGPERALSTLEALAHHQGQVEAPAAVEEPGRIPHELRVGEMGIFGLEPGRPYYGTIDASPLFVVVMLECLRWGGDRIRLADLMPAARAAVEWCRRHVDDHGFIQSRPHAAGLRNQGWKDSLGSMVDAAGTAVEGPTSPIEAQGYLHGALKALAELETRIGEPAAAEPLTAEADDLARRIVAHFASASDESSRVPIAMALDPEGHPLRVSSSNAGHVLDGDALPLPLATKLADRLLSSTDFSGWGIRTLASDESGFNPLGYHIGSVWPHDNAMILRGLSRHGFDDHTRTVVDAMLDLAAANDGQLPELTGGFDRDDISVPIPYLASARPQAWAAAVPFQIVTSLLGLRPDVENRQIDLRPILGPEEWIEIRGLRLGSEVVTISARGTEAEVTRARIE